MDKVKQFFSGSKGDETADAASDTHHTSGGAASSTTSAAPVITTNAPQIGASNVPQVGKPDFGGDFGESGIFTGQDAAGSTSGSAPTASTTASAPSAATTTTSTAQTSLPDRSVTGQGSSEGYTTGKDQSFEPAFKAGGEQPADSHPTFTGNRLDPRFEESTPTFHEEKLDDETHHGGGWKAGSSGPGATTGAVGTASAANSSVATGREASTVGGGEPTHATSHVSAQSGAGSRQDTGPASGTVGPHSSNLANIVDPRVQPDVSAGGSGRADDAGASTSTDPATSSAYGSSENPQADQYVSARPFAGHTVPHAGGQAYDQPAGSAALGGADQGLTGATGGTSSHVSGGAPLASGTEGVGKENTVPVATNTASTTTAQDATHPYHDSSLAVGPGTAGAAGMASYEVKEDDTPSGAGATDTFGTSTAPAAGGEGAATTHAVGSEPPIAEKAGTTGTAAFASDPVSSESATATTAGAEQHGGEKQHQGLLDKILHGDHQANKLHKDPPS